MKSPVILALLGIVLVGCAKEKKYDEVYKESTFQKDLLTSDINDPWVYTPSVENTPMNVTASRSYTLGDPKLVIFKFREKNLEVLQIPTDKRFAQNENNYSPVFKLDVDYKDYRCAEDQFGECGNKEEEVDDKNWSQKRFFKADFSKLTTLETNTLPEQLSNLFNKCFSDEGSVVKKVDMTPDSLNISVERTMTAGIECADVESFDDLRNLSFKINYHYSFVKLSKLASPGYKPVIYPNTDRNTFGFFTSETKKLTADNRTTLDSDVTYMNRWNPERKEITYYLNDGFYEEGMDKLRADSIKAIETVNKSFATAGVDLKIKLEDGRGKAVGDLRNNFLVLVTDPQASGVIGYGPSVANPLNGEIIKGQVVMFYGTIRKYIQETYDELVLEAQEKAANAQSEAAATGSKAVSGGQFKGVSSEMAQTQSAAATLKRDLMNMFQIQDTVTSTVAAPMFQVPSIVANVKLDQKLQKEIFSHDRIAKTFDIENVVEEMSRKSMTHHSMINWNDSVQSAIDAGDLDLTNAKPWNELTDEEKEVLINKLMPYVWIPTLVHEFGHNLGLRHNFNGSEDKDNYYTEAERTAAGIDRNVTYSSVMDYSYSSLNQLPIMGKYDIAALRFGYGRQVEMKDGSIVELKTPTLEAMKKDPEFAKLKDYKYCTDEHTSVNPGCNRFDEGSTLAEMAQNYVDSYKKNYEKRNKRNNKLRFSSVDDASYYMSLRNTFEGLRLFFETYDRIKGMYPTLPADQWESNEFLKDIKAATTIAANFFIDVIKTPSVHCAVVDVKTGKLAGIVPLENITQEAISCFDDENIGLDKSKYAVAGQTGKHVNHARGPYLRGDIKADPTQLDVRGIWADKILAMDYLMKRELGVSTFDDYRSSFIDHAEYKDQILEAVVGLMNDKISKKVEIELANGTTIPFEHTFEIGETHNIKKSFSYGLSRYLGMNKASTDLREITFPMLKKNLMTADDVTKTQGLLNSFLAIKVEPTTFLNPSEIAVAVDLKDAEGRSGVKFAATSANVMAKSMIEKREVRVKLEKFARSKLIEVYLARSEGGKIPEVIVDAEKDLYAMDLKALEAYLLGQMPSDTLMQKLLTIMSK